jgi:predicted ATPase
MKPVLYLNYFRGFNDTYLQLENVNFFVGENSTGKTSVLKVVKLLSDPDFWFKSNLKNLRTEFGYYSEITNNEYFEIGLITDEFSKFVKMRFVDSQGLPELREVFQIDSSLNIHVIKTFEKVIYKHKITDTGHLFKENFFENFKNWINDNGLSDVEPATDKIDKNINIPFFIHIQFLISQKIKAKKSLMGLPFPILIDSLAWLAPIRTEPKRTYDDYELNFSPEGNHTPYILKEELTSKKPTKHTKEFKRILTRFGEDSGLYEKVEVTQLGQSTTAPFEINIVLNKRPLRIINVGYGVSQILPLIVEIVARTKNTWFALQQPEIHLHPRGQAAFGDLLLKSATTEGKNFIVETHSDYTIDRFRLKLKNYVPIKKLKKPECQIVFFTRSAEGNNLDIIKICDDGSYSEDQPKAFKEFFIKEELALLQI